MFECQKPGFIFADPKHPSTRISEMEWNIENIHWIISFCRFFDEVFNIDIHKIVKMLVSVPEKRIISAFCLSFLLNNEFSVEVRLAI